MSLPTTTSPPPRPAAAPVDYSKRLLKARIYWRVAAPGTRGQIDRYSFNTSGRYQVADPYRYGLAQLVKLIDKLGDQVSRAIIYDNQAPGHPEVQRKERGQWVVKG